MLRNYTYIVIGALLCSIHSTVFADLIFSSPPRGSEVDERTTYEPLVQAMSKALNEKVIYERPRNFITYSVDMQQGHYDIVFDGAHFAQWRVTNLHHTILVNLPESVQFLIITQASRTKVNTLHDLVYEQICAQVTPQLGTLMLLQNYNERASEPRLRLVPSEDMVLSDFKAEKCTAAIVRDKVFNKLSATERAAYKVVYKTAIAPNNAITVNSKVTPAQRNALIALFTNPEAMKVSSRIFERYSRSAVAFNVAEPAQFAGLDKLLSLTFGWDAVNPVLRGYTEAPPSNKKTTSTTAKDTTNLGISAK